MQDSCSDGKLYWAKIVLTKEIQLLLRKPFKHNCLLMSSFSDELSWSHMFRKSVSTFSTKSYAIAFDLLLLWMLLPSNFKDENTFLTFWLENNTNLVRVRRTELKYLQWFSDCVFLGRISSPMWKKLFPQFYGGKFPIAWWKKLFVKTG